MSSHVFANGREVLCGASTGQVLAAFPDVCLSPPGPPAGPIPIPYPNFAKAADVANGSRQVFIKGKPLIKRETSYIKKITGDEAATRSFGGSVITHTITGTAWFQSWSPNVYVEGEEVVRHLDLCTTNHASTPGSTPPMAAMASADAPASSTGGSCAKPRNDVATKCDEDEVGRCPDDSNLQKAKRTLREKRKSLRQRQPPVSKDDFKKETASELADTRTEYEKYAREMQGPCRRAQRCTLSPYDKKTCCRPQTPHHVVDAASFSQKKSVGKGRELRADCPNYRRGDALCVCADGNDNNTGTHGLLHLKQRQWTQQWRQQQPGYDEKKPPTEWALSDAVASGVKAITLVFPTSGCDPDCLAKQILDNHQKMGIQPDQKIGCRPSGAGEQTFEKDWAKFNDDEFKKMNEAIANKPDLGTKDLI